jgi:hypothetical protein
LNSEATSESTSLGLYYLKDCLDQSSLRQDRGGSIIEAVQYREGRAVFVWITHHPYQPPAEAL